MKMKRRLFVAIALLGSIFLITDSSSWTKDIRGVTDTSIIIGSIGDHTGPTSNFAVPIVAASKNFFLGVNDRGGINGRKIKFIIEDSRYSIPSAMAAFKKLVSKDEALAILGPVSVGEVRVLFRHIKENKIICLPYAPDRSIMEPYKRYIFPANGFYDNELGVIFNHIFDELKAKNLKIALCYPDVESGKVVKRATEEWAESFGVKLHFEVIPVSAIDVTSQILSMKKAGITHILVHHVAPGAAAVLNGLKRFGLNIPVFGTSGTTTEDIIGISGEAVKNFTGVSAYSSWYEETPGIADMRKISMKYNPDAEKSYRTKSYSIGWATAYTLSEGLRRAGKNLNSETLVDALESIKDLDTRGICGPITYTPQIHNGLNYNKLFRADPATVKLISISDWRLPASKK